MPSTAHHAVWPKRLPHHITVPATSLWDNLATNARRYPDKAALIFFGRVVTYAALAAQAERVAAWLQAQGVVKGDRVLLNMQNCPQLVAAHFGILRANAVVVPVTAVRLGSSGDYVYVLNAAERTVSLRPVKRGPATVDKIVAQPDTVAQVTKVVGYTVPNPLKLALGTTLLHFLQQEHNRTGLFLLATGEPRTYVLTRPSVLAAPTWRIVRRRGMSWGIVETPQFNNDTAGRFSHYTVRGRGGGGTDSTGAVRKQIEGTYVDQEMVDYGLIKQWSHVDQIAKTSKQAEYLAHRMAAEKARAGWHLSYKLRGLSWPALAGGMAVWARDSVVDIQDDELNIHGPHWISDVAQSGAATGGTTTTITLHKPEHQLYGDEDRKSVV